ncbi:hypothetical protein [Parvularcula marina]|uniref:hypothetical protein n=1 Tax=Parvularcula marina TaxID=2292771 RepID=UPI0013146B01|nr:hypothetical protein [Parvularcula marina]
MTNGHAQKNLYNDIISHFIRQLTTATVSEQFSCSVGGGTCVHGGGTCIQGGGTCLRGGGTCIGGGGTTG